MKALILAAGEGKRLNYVTKEKNKCIVEVGFRPVIENSFNYASMIDDIREIVVVVGYKSNQIVSSYGNMYKGKKLIYVYQNEQIGMVNAILCAKDALQDHDFMLFLGDEIIVNPKHNNMLKAFKSEEAFSFCGVVSVDDDSLIEKTYTLLVEKNGIISKLIEKPKKPLSKFIGTGNCIFRNRFFKYIEIACSCVNIHQTQFTDIIQSAINYGEIVKPYIIGDRYCNINTREDLIIAEQFLNSF